MDRVRTRDLVRKGVTASTAKQAFEDNLDQDGSSRGGGREYKKRNPRTGHPQPQSYSFDQPSTSQPQAASYQTQGPGYYAPPSNYGQTNYGYGQAASGAPQYPAYPPTPQQSPPPTSCTCTLCQHCLPHFADCYHAQSQIYYCRYHHGQIMKWVNPGRGFHNCPSNQSPPPNQQSYSGYQQHNSTSSPSYTQCYGQASGGAPRDLYSNGSPTSPGPQSYQGSPQSNYTLGGPWTQEPAQLPDQAGVGEASSYYYPSEYPTWPRLAEDSVLQIIITQATGGISMEPYHSTAMRERQHHQRLKQSASSFKIYTLLIQQQSRLDLPKRELL
ncbi:hypothetical protein M409DRAFT_21839 [Zasmidium cellare ATCC 36951]|uniref:Uncharacterized protein n=1 Tax=Zasmidium cellare ATCC 36951 TaxID=1080233 RepID=A0A6A6CQE4_ZASCE|nr:uncharacterized protein M409DRAFT_21839 [Zasmidium cellare ATCC 36951]KAF2167686.1 hypothetical protein M409DRAFT_21839 [Zasmidium cellare ATCC 36951]